MYTPFLRQIAQYFQDKGDVHDYCFVLPNHRSCTFLERELDNTSNGVFLMPEIMTISDFMGQLTRDIVVNPVDALFTLYKCYTSLTGEQDYAFDKFVFWGNVVLNDFNDVDMNYVDAKDLFNNVRADHELMANVMGPDLRELLSHYFKLNPSPFSPEDEERFWLNYETSGGDGDDVRTRYLKLWQSLLPLYESYNAELKAQGLSSLGQMYRHAVDVVKDGKDLGHKCYVFVGFNMLTNCEMAIFKRLANRQKALFFWDTASPALAQDNAANVGGKYVNFFKREFPEPVDFYSEPISGFPAVEVVGVPSNVGQVKCVSSLIDRLIEEKKITNTLDAINTAIVLPDEGLFVPLLNSMNPNVPNVNVTMGYPLRSSDMASLMRVVAKMHRQARREAGREWYYYRNDVKVLLSHPIIKSCFGIESLKVIQQIDAENLFAVPQSMFEDLPFATLFKTVENQSDSASVIEFLQQLKAFCEKVLSLLAIPEEDATSDTGDDENTTARLVTLQEAFVAQYIEVLDQLIDALGRFQVPQCEATIFFLVDRLAGVFSVPFKGEPLMGLQVMGMLETRCLDFDNVIILSANERVLPRKYRSSSFITDFLRHDRGMPTIDDQESMWSYHFYRLISRASNLYMFYDTSTQSMGSSEVSRFVNQLKMVYGCSVKEVNLDFTQPVTSDVKISVPKQGHVSDVLDEFKQENGRKRLSASTINDYINCPLAFFMGSIEGLKAGDEEEDFMDRREFGTIVHDTLQQLYYPDYPDGTPREGEYKVTCDMIKEFKRQAHLDAVLCRMVNKSYTRKKNLNEPLTGEASIVSAAIRKFVIAALDYDINLLGDNGYFTVLECERRHNDVKLVLGNHTVYFNYTADRIDRIDGIDGKGPLRMVDYKTGSDKTQFASLDDLFVLSKERRKAILQLMLYCNAYAQEKGYDGEIKPMIYALRDMRNKSNVDIVRVSGKDKQPLDNYLEINDEFIERMEQLLDNLFDTSQPFTQAPKAKDDPAYCRSCKFADFCRR